MPTRTGYVGTQIAGDVLTAANFTKLPGGWIGYAEKTANESFSGVETAISGLSVTVTVGTDRRIRVTGAGVMVPTVATNTRAYGVIQQDSTGVGRFLEHYFRANDYEHRDEASVILTPSAGSHTYRLTCLAVDDSSAATGIQVQASSVRPAFILVEDIGPAT